MKKKSDFLSALLDDNDPDFDVAPVEKTTTVDLLGTLCFDTLVSDSFIISTFIFSTYALLAGLYFLCRV